MHHRYVYVLYVWIVWTSIFNALHVFSHSLTSVRLRCLLMSASWQRTDHVSTFLIFHLDRSKCNRTVSIWWHTTSAYVSSYNIGLVLNKPKYCLTPLFGNFGWYKINKSNQAKKRRKKTTHRIFEMDSQRPLASKVVSKVIVYCVRSGCVNKAFLYTCHLMNKNFRPRLEFFHEN